MKKLSLTLMIGSVLLVSACGGGGGSNDSTPAAADTAPGWAFADSAAYTRYTDGVQASASDSASPVDMTAADAPGSDTDEPVTI
jgi:hypothetical protein